MRTPPRRTAGLVGAGQLVPAAGTDHVRSKGPSPLSKDSELAGAIKALVVAGDRDAARDRFAELVARQQRRAVRIAYSYLRDAHDADEAVQDAFFKVFTHITTYREELPFEVWFTRILVNGCLDLRKARARRLRWALPMSESASPPEPIAPQPSPEARLMSSDRARQIAAAVAQLPDRQRTVFTLCHLAEQTTSEVSQALGLSEATVRVHLFRAVRKLRKLLVPEREAEAAIGAVGREGSMA
jgi:RNA polymerase sigma-70 factor, ECF subfamily